MRRQLMLTIGVASVVAAGFAVSAAAEGINSADEGPYSQEQALADGVVTVEEQNATVTATVECLRAAGVVVHGPAPADDHGTLAYSYVAGATPEEVARADTAYERCEAVHYREVGRVWTRQLGPGVILRVPSGADPRL